MFAEISRCDDSLYSRLGWIVRTGTDIGISRPTGRPGSHGTSFTERDMLLFFRLWSFHAHVPLVVCGRKLTAIQGIWPLESKLDQHGLAKFFHGFAEGSARSDGLGHFVSTHGRIHRTQEKSESGGTPILDQRSKSLELKISIPLNVMSNKVRHPGDIISNISASLNTNRLTSSSWYL